MSARREGEKLEVDKEAVGSKKIKELQEMSVKLQNEKREETNSKLATKEHAEKPPKDATDGASDAAAGSTSEVKAPSYSCYVCAQTGFTSLQQLTEHSEARHSDGRTTQSKKSEKIGGVPEKLEECPKCKEVMSSTKMARHKLSPHSEQCGLACKLKFSSSLDLAYHYLVGHHSPDLVKGDGFLHCSKCFEVFKPCQKSLLENHEKNGKHLVCSRDNRAFNKSKESAYKHHISQEHTLKCNRCELSFLPADRLFLEKHKKEAHMGEGDGDHLVDDFEEKEEGSKRRSRTHEAQVERLETIPTGSTVDGAGALEKALGENPVPADKGASGDGEQENICWLCCAAEPAVELRVCKGCNRVGRVHCAG